MLQNEFVEKFAACFNYTKTETITATTRYADLEEWGSMMTLIVIAMIDADYEKVITAEDLKRAVTIADLFDIVKQK